MRRIERVVYHFCLCVAVIYEKCAFPLLWGIVVALAWFIVRRVRRRKASQGA